jgi:hypothetical protein
MSKIAPCLWFNGGASTEPVPRAARNRGSVCVFGHSGVCLKLSRGDAYLAARAGFVRIFSGSMD